MTTHTARGPLWMLTLHDKRVTIFRLMPSTRGREAGKGWTERQVATSMVRRVDLVPSRRFRKGRLTLQLDMPFDGVEHTETILFDRTQQQAIADLAAALRADIASWDNETDQPATPPRR